MSPQLTSRLPIVTFTPNSIVAFSVCLFACPKLGTIQTVDLLPSLRYCTYAGDEIAIITTAAPTEYEITQSHESNDVPCLTRSGLANLK